METSLQSLMDLAGVNAALVFDGTGRLAAHRGRAVYDRALCEQVGAALARAVDSVQLEYQDWDSVTAKYADGSVLLRNLGSFASGSYVLAVVGDAALNPAFAIVAIRVAATKLRKLLEGGPAAASGQLGSQVGHPPPGAPHLGSQVGHGPGGSQVAGAGSSVGLGSRPVLANSGLSWSRTTASGLSAIAAADPASSAWLTRCAKELARYVGPISKLYVEETVRRLWPDQVFGLAQGKPLYEDLATQIEDEQDRAAYLKAMAALK
jgi:hypothetical protein